MPNEDDPTHLEKHLARNVPRRFHVLVEQERAMLAERHGLPKPGSSVFKQIVGHLFDHEPETALVDRIAFHL